MAGGWAKEGAVQEQIDASVDDAIALARSQLPHGKSRTHCLECDTPIPQARRDAIPGVQYCVACQNEIDQATRHASSPFNRRASKGSQLR